MTAPSDSRLSRGLVLLFAITTGVAVANLYYVQPLLDEIGGALHVSSAVAGLLVTATQLGYVLGLVLLVPVGDLVERRGLITRLLLFAAVALVVCAAAPSFPILALALLATGALSCVAQVVVALASHLADEGSRGRVVGSVMSGLLIGILSARTVSGLVAELGGWRLVFALAAGAVLATAVLIRFATRPVPATSEIGYGAALRSVGSLVRELPVLRQRMLLGALHFAGFSVLWTSITFLLSGSPYDLGEGAIGLFGLAGIAGAAIAPVAGRLADRGKGRLAQTFFLSTILVSWGLLALGRSSVIPLVLGIILLDLGVQGTQISNQAAVYALHGQARSRLTTAYMASVFVGGVIGSALASWVYGWGGWGPTCVLGALLAATELAVWGVSERYLAASPILEAPLVQTSRAGTKKSVIGKECLCGGHIADMHFTASPERTRADELDELGFERQPRLTYAELRGSDLDAPHAAWPKPTGSWRRRCRSTRGCGPWRCAAATTGAGSPACRTGSTRRSCPTGR